MDLNKIVQGINTKLAGEMMTYDMLKPYLDEVIDDINDKLNTKFPVFSEFTSDAYPLQYPNYNFFPDSYIRKVVMTGVAHKFYTTDEEGLGSAKQFQWDFIDALFIMERDYLESIPEEYQANRSGSVKFDESGRSDTPFNFGIY